MAAAPPPSASPVSYSCTACGADLALDPADIFPADMPFDGGNKGTLSFSKVDSSRFLQANQVGNICYDGPALNGGHGQLGLGTSQVLHRFSRYRIKLKAVTPIYRHGDMALGVPLYSFDGQGKLENGDDKPAGMGRLPFWAPDPTACTVDGFFLSSFSDGTSLSSFEDAMISNNPFELQGEEVGSTLSRVWER
eukprot:SM000012S25270  [mRNA]  locus=s12:6458:13160:+ [translate_table: standard]